MKEYYAAIEQFVVLHFGDNQTDILHSRRAAYWIHQLLPDADEALLTAAISHDIERAFRKKHVDSATLSSKSFLDEDDLRHHQEEGAKIVAEQLLFLKAPQEFINKVTRLISRHEIGGYQDENVLKDADSVSFFENNIDFFITEMSKRRTRSSIKEKFDWMYSRISSRHAKDLAQGWYEVALQRLNQLER